MSIIGSKSSQEGEEIRSNDYGNNRKGFCSTIRIAVMSNQGRRDRATFLDSK